MSSSGDELERALRALRVEYLAAAPARVAELWIAFSAVQNGGREALEDLRVLVHRLAGSGGGYGFPDVTRAAQAADVLCRSLLEAPAPGLDEFHRLRACIQDIADAFGKPQAPE